ncbi:hypothetical protein, partial [Arthrobacter sp. 1088]|uniref:hypothetical protein n=1 Tax=Arthrobacter sp. 1088 TaxID=2817768 RepID=UPI00286CF4FD
TRLHKIRNQLKTKPPHTGVRSSLAIISTNQKTIGINKLGTLLSSQTTGHYSKAEPPAFAGSLRSNFSNLPAGPLGVKSASMT